MHEYTRVMNCIKRLRSGGNISRVNAEDAAYLLEHYLVLLSQTEEGEVIKDGHVDEFIETPVFPSIENMNLRLAMWFLNYKRMPAHMQTSFADFMEGGKMVILCDYEGNTYRCTGASRLGDVWLTSDFSQAYGYEKRVNINSLSNWSKRIR